jgi:hypothetical protein
MRQLTYLVNKYLPEIDRLKNREVSSDLCYIEQLFDTYQAIQNLTCTIKCLPVALCPPLMRVGQSW